MTIRPWPLTAALASAGALALVVPALGTTPLASPALASVSASLAYPVSSAVQLLSDSEHYSGYSDDDEGDDHEGDDDEGEDHDHDGGQFGGFIADFLAANQAQVLAVTAMIPVFNIGPVAVGNSLLANAYFNGYDGSAPGLDGVVSYVTSQLGTPPADLLQGIVLGVTSLVPQFNIGPVAVGHSLLANAFFNGYDGSATGVPGIVSYVTSQLGVQPTPGAAVTAGAAAASLPRLGSPRTVAPVAAASVTTATTAAPATGRQRVSAAAATGGGHVKARGGARAAAKAGADGES